MPSVLPPCFPLRDSIRSATFYPVTTGIFSIILLQGMLFSRSHLYGFFPRRDGAAAAHPDSRGYVKFFARQMVFLTAAIKQWRKG
ncbi:MAG: hypothetical protein ACOX7L_04355 [Dethiobacteria bacterium]